MVGLVSGSGIVRRRVERVALLDVHLLSGGVLLTGRLGSAEKGEKTMWLERRQNEKAKSWGARDGRGGKCGSCKGAWKS